jgi:hypothetical protein
VREGAYDVPEGQGLMKGKYRVEFSVPKAGRRVPNPDISGAWMVDLEEPCQSATTETRSKSSPTTPPIPSRSTPH